MEPAARAAAAKALARGAVTANLEVKREGAVSSVRVNEEVLAAVIDTMRSVATKVEVVLTLPPAGPDGKSEFHVNGVPFWRAKPFLAKLGETQLWEIRNDSDWDHPFHLHGYFFIPVDDTGAPLRPMEWKDTLNVPMKSTLRFLVTFDERPGEWMFHCHILDHAEGGLMGTVKVGDGPTREHVHGRRD